MQLNETLNRHRGVGLPPPVVSATAVVGQGRMDEERRVDMRAEIGPSPWSGMSWKRGNWRILGCSTEISRPEKPATERGRRASSSLYKLVGFVQYRYPSIVTIRAATDAARISSNEEHAKPFSMLLPALKPKHFCLDCPRRWCQGLPLRLSGCRVGKEHVPSPKR